MAKTVLGQLIFCVEVTICWVIHYRVNNLFPHNMGFRDACSAGFYEDSKNINLSDKIH
jgi:hypothetical protein